MQWSPRSNQACDRSRAGGLSKKRPPIKLSPLVPCVHKAMSVPARAEYCVCGPRGRHEARQLTKTDARLVAISSEAADIGCVRSLPHRPQLQAKCDIAHAESSVGIRRGVRKRATECGDQLRMTLPSNPGRARRRPCLAHSTKAFREFLRESFLIVHAERNAESVQEDVELVVIEQVLVVRDIAPHEAARRRRIRECNQRASSRFTTSSDRNRNANVRANDATIITKVIP